MYQPQPRPRTYTPISCRYCGETFDSGGIVNRVYCSVRCRKAQARKVENEKQKYSEAERRMIALGRKMIVQYTKEQLDAAGALAAANGLPEPLIYAAPLPFPWVPPAGAAFIFNKADDIPGMPAHYRLE